MSPDAQHLDRYFKPSGTGQQPPIDPVRYQEELKDFTSFFEKLSSLDTMDWFASDEAPAPRPAACDSSALPRSQEAAAPADSITTLPHGPPSPAPAAAIPLPVESPAEAEPAAGAAEELAAEAVAGFAAAPAPMAHARMQIFHSTQDPDIQAAPAGYVGYDARAILSGSRHGAPWRGFLGRLQIVLLVAFGATLLFAMGLGMGALVLSLPRGAAFGDHQSLVAQDAGGNMSPDKAGETPSKTERVAPGQETIGDVTLPAYPAGAESRKTAQPNAARAPKREATAAKPAATQAPPAKADSNTAAPAPARQIARGNDPRPAEPVAQAAVPAGAEAAAAAPDPASTAPALSGALPAPATPSTAPAADAMFALQVGACSSYACIEQFRNLLLAEVDSNRIKVSGAGEGNQAIQRVRIEPLSRDAALHLKETLAAKDARFAKAYLVSVH